MAIITLVLVLLLAVVVSGAISRMLPLLFLDGWRIPSEKLRKDGKTILELALGLVVFTVVGGGFFIRHELGAVSRSSRASQS